MTPHEIIAFRQVLEDIKDDILTKETNLGVSIIVAQTFNAIDKQLDIKLSEASDEMVNYYEEN